MDEGPVRLYILGDNAWRNEQEWPLARTQYTDYYLHSNGGAQTPRGDGNLSPDQAGDESPDHYVYDPRDPVPSCHLMHDQDGVFDQRVLDARADVLVYQTEPLNAPLEVTGEPTLHLYAASSAVDTDFTAKLVDVHPDGFAQNLCYGVVRARYRNGYGTPQLLAPGQVYELPTYSTPLQCLPTGTACAWTSLSDFPTGTQPELRQRRYATNDASAAANVLHRTPVPRLAPSLYP